MSNIIFTFVNGCEQFLSKFNLLDLFVVISRTKITPRVVYKFKSAPQSVERWSRKMKINSNIMIGFVERNFNYLYTRIRFNIQNQHNILSG